MKYFLTLMLLVSTQFTQASDSKGLAILSGMRVCMNHAESDKQKLDCAKRGFSIADAYLNTEFRGALTRYRNSENAEGIAHLRSVQREWIDFRNNMCGGSPDHPVNRDGSPLSANQYACFAEKSVVRAEDLSGILAD